MTWIVVIRWERVTWICAVAAVLILMSHCSFDDDDNVAVETMTTMSVKRRFGERRCEEIYVVGVGETLQSISEKCGDPYIVEQNPHIQDPDDVFPGLVIKITPFITTT